MKKAKVTKIAEMVRLSVTSKLDGIKSWSLQAGDTCPGSLDNIGQLVAACQGCYAMGGNYRFANVRAPREYNREDWKRDSWADEMVQALNNERYFRWFDSGDMYAIGLAKKIYAVMVATPWVKHWLPTRMLKFAKFQAIIAKMNELQNVVVRFSSDSVIGEFTPGLHGSTIAPTLEAVPAGAMACLAYQNEGKCNGCRQCWNKNVDVVAYIAHGKSMAKVVQAQLVAAGLID